MGEPEPRTIVSGCVARGVRGAAGMQAHAAAAAAAEHAGHELSPVCSRAPACRAHALLCCRLVKYVPLEDMQGRPVIVLCNLKPRNMRGIKSAGMLLAASDAGHEVVEPLSPPPGAAPGSRVWWGEHEQQVRERRLCWARQQQRRPGGLSHNVRCVSAQPAARWRARDARALRLPLRLPLGCAVPVPVQAKPMEPNPLTKKKVWEGVQPVLRTDAARRANFKGAAMRTAEGPVTSASLVDARIG